MRFRKYDRSRSKNKNRDERLSIELQPRSIYLMSGASRESWQHAIPPVKELRYAIMMRTLRAEPGNGMPSQGSTAHAGQARSNRSSR
jgi:hypothetical protein